MKTSRLVIDCLLAFYLGGGAALARDAGGAGTIPLTKGRESASVIVYPGDCALSTRMAGKLANYLREHTAAQVPVLTDDQFKAASPDTAVIVLDGTANHRLAGRFGIRVTIASEHPDAYRLKVVAAPNRPAAVIVAGKGPSGMKYAAYRLMRELDIKEQQARIRTLDVSAEPFIKTRSVALFNVWNMPIEVTRRHNTESWAPERLGPYIDMYDAYGFNAIESHDRFDDGYLEPLFGLKREVWRKKVQHMCDQAHLNGQEFFLRVWGHVVMNTPEMTEPLGPNSAVPKKLSYLCVNDPQERRRWETEIRDYYVRHYGGRIDHLIGHWCDPGVCRRNGCDYQTPLRLQMELHRAFKAVDPNFKSTFSLWFFDRTKGNPESWARRGWPGYNNDLDLIGAGILDQEVLIATYTTTPGPYQPEVVQAILDHGHRPALWTWYRADHETRPSVHVHVHKLLGDYFRNLPASARELEWHNVERNVHGAANTANYYVAGRLMWEPALNPDELLREFLTLIFGAQNAGRILPAYQAIAKIRCHSCEEGAWLTGIGTKEPAADARTAEAALAGLAQAKVDPSYRPRIPLDLPPEQILADLRASLEVIRDYATFRATVLPGLEKAVAAGDRDTAHWIQEQIRQKHGGWHYTLAGRQEWALIDRLFKAQEKRLEPRKAE